MRNHKQSKGDLTMTWVAVRGEDGHVRMEARWISAASMAASRTAKPNPHAA